MAGRIVLSRPSIVPRGAIAQGVRSQVSETVRSWIPQRLKRHVLFLRFHGTWGNFTHPRTFSEKINWRILYDRRPELAWTCDKLESKRRAEAAGVRSPITYWAGDDVSKLADIGLRTTGSSSRITGPGWCISDTDGPDVDELELVTARVDRRAALEAPGRVGVLAGPSPAPGRGTTRAGWNPARLQILRHGRSDPDHPSRCRSLR